ncbi:MAG: hypothetical protein SFW36_04605 [Leptolyngbyaceae cyanobacterium bins.59]|nr:hypothetical protein [Leptolyngbyaceae cyanobacterium bins.59]
MKVTGRFDESCLNSGVIYDTGFATTAQPDLSSKSLAPIPDRDWYTYVVGFPLHPPLGYLSF